MSDPDLKRIWSEFYIQYGSAMVAWALIESELATLFSVLTKIPPDMAMQIFYSARSFKGRTSIFKSSLETCKTTEEVKSFVRAVIKKADQYSDCRNKFAHDLPVLNQPSQSPKDWYIAIVDGKAQFQTDEKKLWYREHALTVEDIEQISLNFQTLGKLIWSFWGALTTNKISSLHIFQQQLAALPNLPAIITLT